MTPALASSGDAPMLADIARQPEVLAAILSRADTFRNFASGRLTPAPGGRLFIIGCGDGLFAAQAAEGFATALGLAWRPLGSLSFLLAASAVGPADRVLAISMSGNVDRTVEAATAAAAAGAGVAALCNGRGGRLAEVAGTVLSLDIPDLAPFLCGTSSYVATLLSLFLIAEGASGRRGPDLGSLPHHAADVLGRGLPDGDILAAAPSGVRFLSAGADLGTAAYGAAKLVELTLTPSWSAELEEFAHSQFWSMPGTDLVVCVVGPSAALARHAQGTADALAGLGVTTFAVVTDPLDVPAARWSVRLPAVPEAVSPILAALPLQVFAYALSQRTGFDPNRRPHLKTDEARFMTSRLLTRRSLLGTGQ